MMNQFEEIKETLFRFLETRVDLLEVETRSYIERIILKLVYAALVVMAVIIIVVFLLLLLAIYLNSLLESVFLGYLLIVVFFTLILVVLITLRKRCLRFIRWILEKTMDDDD